MSLFVFGSSILIIPGNDTKQDVWLAIILGFIMCLPMIFIYAKLLTLYPGKGLYDILNEAFGKITGKIVTLLYVWYFFHLGAMIIRNFSEFINVTSFPETPQAIFIIFIGLYSIWMVKAGIEVLGRWATFTFPIVVFIIVITVTLSMTNANFIHLRPILYNGIKPVMIGAYSFFTFPLAETVVFTVFFNTLKNGKKTFKVFLISTLIGSIVILIICVNNILVLGAPLTTSLYFPSYVAVRTLNIGDFLQRFEIVVTIVFIFGGLVKISVCLYASTLGVAKILNVDNYRFLVAPVGLLMMYLAAMIYENIMEMFDFAKVYAYYAIPFQIILPIIILIAAKIKIRANSKKEKLPA